MHKVENLKKVTIAIRAPGVPNSKDGLPNFLEFDFIFGLAPEGMTPFEYELAGKLEGDDIQLHLKKNILSEFFGHLNPPIRNLCQGSQVLNLDVKILEIATPANREVVKAMAQMAAQGGAGCGCDCGCGCG